MSLQQFFGKPQEANWPLYASKEQRGTKLTIGFLSMILAIGASLWIGEGIFLQYTSMSSRPLCNNNHYTTDSEAKSTQFCMAHWSIFVKGSSPYGPVERTKVPQFAWYKIHPTITFLMGLMYVLCNYIWWMWEKGLVTKFTSGFRDRAVPTMSQTGEQRMVQDVRTDSLNYIVRWILHNGSLNWYLAKYFGVLFLTLAVLVGQLSYLLYLFGANLDFATYNQLFNNMLRTQEERALDVTDVALLKFPISFYCIRNIFGPSGTLQAFEVDCDNDLNGYVEYYYIINLYVITTLLIVWLVTLLQTLLSLVFFRRCFTGLTPNEYNSSAFCHFGYGKKLMFMFIYQNVEPLFLFDIIQSVKDSHNYLEIA